VDLLAGHRNVVIAPGSDLGKNRYWASWLSRLVRIIRDEDPDWLMVMGYSAIANWIAMHARGRARLLYLSDSNDGVSTTAARRAIKQLPIRYFFRRVDRFLTPGDANRRFLRKFGVDDERMVWYPFGIDTARFAPRGKVVRLHDLLWAGKLIERKRAGDFVAALRRLASDGVPFRAVLAGDGPERAAIADLGADLVSNGNLELRGFVNQADMPSVLQSAQTFVMTSVNEPYGLAATEAAACGCAIIVAAGAGCIGDRGSAVPQRNALVYEPGNVAALAEAMKSVIQSPSRLQAMQVESRSVSAVHSVEQDARVIREVVLS
jgi:glycosyltransferase involved in cell wall biosynthesis